MLISNAATPVNSYNGGSGFFYKRYSVSTGTTVSQFKGTLDNNTINASLLLDSYISG
jgi:hypothetical protein